MVFKTDCKKRFISISSMVGSYHIFHLKDGGTVRWSNLTVPCYSAGELIILNLITGGVLHSRDWFKERDQDR